jgi:hypothetical protein
MLAYMNASPPCLSASNIATTRLPPAESPASTTLRGAAPPAATSQVERGWKRILRRPAIIYRQHPAAGRGAQMRRQPAIGRGRARSEAATVDVE